jgi:hypothetical protein
MKHGLVNMKDLWAWSMSMEAWKHGNIKHERSMSMRAWAWYEHGSIKHGNMEACSIRKHKHGSNAASSIKHEAETWKHGGTEHERAWYGNA